MYACKQCGTSNPLDSSFCKKCGAPLPEKELDEAREKLQTMIEEGNALFTEGRTEEAMMIAEAAVAANPSSHLALSLKGLCHERMGQIAEALECYEAAVSLNPDSTLDKIKVNALRNRLAARVIEQPEPSRRPALLAGVAAVVLVTAIGSLIAVNAAAGHRDKPVAMNQPQANGSVTGFPAQTDSQQTPANAQTNNQPTNSAAPAGQGQRDDAQRGGTSDIYVPPYDDGTGGRLPVVSNPNGPINPPGPAVSTERDPGTTPGTDPAPLPNDQNSRSTNVPNLVAKPEDHGIIEIKVASNGVTTKANQPGAEYVDNGGVETLAKAARSQYQLGQYDAASHSYERLIKSGAETPSVDQRLGQCYEKLGNTKAAIGAYNRAIQGFQAKIKAGHSVQDSQTGLDSCIQAVKVLGG